MRPGTPGFRGERLVQAREAWGLSATSLADLVQVSAQSISHYEQNTHSPGPDVMEAIAEKLNFPRSFFLRPLPPEDVAPVFWRSKSAALKVARKRAAVRLSWLKELLSYLETFFDFPKMDLPDFGVSDPLKLTRSDVERMALQCREAWGLGSSPIANVCSALEARGVIISRMRMDADGLDAFCQWPERGNNPLILLGRDKENAARSRFDTAHEMAHLILHRGLDQKRLNSTVDRKVMEGQSHLFASIFLLPPTGFANELWSPTLDSMLNIKERWGCSIAAMIKASEYAGLVDEEQARRLWINYTRRGWRSGEPLDARIAPEAPCLLRKSFEMLVDEGGQPRQQVLLQLHLNPRDVEELAELPSGFFAFSSSVPEFTPRLKVRPEGVQAANVEVVDFARRTRMSS